MQNWFCRTTYTLRREMHSKLMVHLMKTVHNESVYCGYCDTLKCWVYTSETFSQSRSYEWIFCQSRVVTTYSWFWTWSSLTGLYIKPPQGPSLRWVLFMYYVHFCRRKQLARKFQKLLKIKVSWTFRKYPIWEMNIVLDVGRETLLL